MSDSIALVKAEMEIALDFGRIKSFELPEKPTPESLLPLLVEVAKYNTSSRLCRAIMRPIMGRILLEIQGTEAWREWGKPRYHNFSDFMARGMPSQFATPRTEAWSCLRLVERFPSLTVNECRQIGSVKLRELSRVTQEGDTNWRKWVERAKELDQKEFTAIVDEKIGGKEKPHKIEIYCSKQVMELWEQFLQDAKSHYGTASPSEILEYAMMAARHEWQ